MSHYRYADAMGERKYSFYSLLTSALDPAALYSWERTSSTNWIGGWVGLKAGLDTEARVKILCLCRGSNSGRPVCSQTLYWLSCPSCMVDNVTCPTPTNGENEFWVASVLLELLYIIRTGLQKVVPASVRKDSILNFAVVDPSAGTSTILVLLREEKNTKVRSPP
jgi:hypothetical protein